MGPDLSGHAAIVTGAAAGIGRGIAAGLAAAGADVAVCDIQPKIERVAAAIADETGRRVPAWLADVSQPAEVKRFVDAAVDRLGGLDIVVNNAGVWRSSNPLADTWEQAVAQFDLLHGSNLKGVFLVGRAAIPHLLAGGGGHIVNIATDHICPPPGYATGGGRWMDVYDASKWGVNGLTQSWAKTLREHGVRVNALCMDAVDSEMVRYAAGPHLTPEHLATFMQPEQIADLLLELIAEGPAGRTGENIGIWRGHPVELPPRQPELPSRHP